MREERSPYRSLVTVVVGHVGLVGLDGPEGSEVGSMNSVGCLISLGSLRVPPELLRSNSRAIDLSQAMSCSDLKSGGGIVPARLWSTVLGAWSRRRSRCLRSCLDMP